MFIFILATTLFPIIYVIVMGFFRNYLPEKSISFVFLRNYGTIIRDSEFWKALSNTGVYVFFTVLFHILFALFLALFLDKKGIFSGLSKILRSIFITPWLLSWTVAASIWLLILNPAGVLNGFAITLGLLGKQIPWLGEVRYAMGWLVLITVWKALPFFMMFTYAALTTVPAEQYESAQIDGASYSQRLFRITLPQILPTLLTLTVLDVIWSIRQFDIIFLTTAGGPLKSTLTMSLYVYFTAFEKFKFGLSSAQGVMIFLVSSIAALVYLRLYRRAET
jgi:multiple sugar transport system permease protein